MKYLKILIISIATTFLLGSVFAFVYIGNMKSGMKDNSPNNPLNSDLQAENKEILKMELKDAKTLKEAIAASDRLNTIVVGTDGERTDTIILFSYDVTYKMLDVMSIPRDTYIEILGHKRADQHKINAVYGMGSKDGGMTGVKAQVSQILGIPIHYYVMADYKGVQNVVDIIGGVEVDVKERMFYDDPTASPPLHIYFEPGSHNLTGSKVIEYLRWRKNNDGSGGGSDLDRNARQTDFVKRAVSKSVTSLNIINVVNAALKFIETDMSVDDMLYYATTLVGFDMNRNFKTHTLPGYEKMTKLSYFFHDIEETQNLMYEIYMSGYREFSGIQNKGEEKKNP